jgi:hypothetical protein
MAMSLTNASPAARKRNAAAIRRRWQLYVPKAKEKPAPTPELRRQPCTDPNRCAADPACPFPPMIEGRCRQHARDAMAEESSVGTAYAMLRDYGLVTADDRTEIRAHNPTLLRCKDRR